MGIVAELLKKDIKEYSEDDYNTLRHSFYKLFHWCHNKKDEVDILERIGEEYRNKIIDQEDLKYRKKNYLKFENTEYFIHLINNKHYIYT